MRFCFLRGFVTGSVDYSAALLTEGVFVTKLLSFINCVRYVTLLFHERTLIYIYIYNYIDHILPRNCLLKQVIERKIKGEIEVTRRQGRRRKKLLDDLKDRRGYCHLKEEAVDRNMWRDHFGRGFEPVVRQTTG